MNRRALFRAGFAALAATAVPVTARATEPDPICDDVMGTCPRILVIADTHAASMHMRRMFPRAMHCSVGAALTGHRFDIILIAYSPDAYDGMLRDTRGEKYSVPLIAMHKEWLNIMLSTRLVIGGRVGYLT